VRHEELTERITGAAYDVHNELGTGLVEKVYENALVLELREAGVAVAQQAPIVVEYRGQVVGEFVADLVVDGRVIVEVGSVSELAQAHAVQLVDYGKATRTRGGGDAGGLQGDSSSSSTKWTLKRPSA
jgi:GxxExxY protein